MVIVSVMFVCSKGESYVIITHNALDLTVEGPLPRACSNLLIMNHVRLASEQLASYWNAFLF